MDFMDTLTKEIPVVQVEDDSLHTTENRGLCMVQATATYNNLALPEAQENYLKAIGGDNPFGINLTPEPILDDGVKGCGDDIDCLKEVALENSYSATIMGHIVAKLVYNYQLSDGYNQLGDEDCTVSCRPFKDTTGYQPKSCGPKKSKKGPTTISCDRWQPLLEDNGRGFFYYQEHVTPHIGTKAKLRVVPEAERDEFVAPKPRYSKNRLTEARFLIEKMRLLDDYKKIEVEVFDDKLRVGTAIVDAFLAKMLNPSSTFMEPFVAFQKRNIILSLERFVNWLQGFLAVEEDAIIIAWKEKVAYDLVRPTTVIKTLGDQEITTWTPEGVRTFPAKDFEAYKRVMPHSEYVSGTSCLFQAQTDYITAYLDALKVSDPESFPIQFPGVGPGESNVQPGVVPSSCVVLSYPSIAAMGDAGGMSRINGGIHFPAAVTNGKILCERIGSFGADDAFALYGAVN